MDIFTAFKNKKVFVTGHTGFKGSWLSIMLQLLGAEVTGYSLPPSTALDNFAVCDLSSKMTDLRGDVRDGSNLKKAISAARPDFIFHLAAQPLVRESYLNPRYTLDTNINGVINLLEALREYDGACTVLIITSDKCYENTGEGRAFTESDRLGGYDPYSTSKACAELIVASYRSSFFDPSYYPKHGKLIATLRACNAIGGGDWSADRIIPDCIRAIRSSSEIRLRSPHSVRSWQHVLDILIGYLTLAYSLNERSPELSGAWNFGAEEDMSVAQLVTMLAGEFNYNRIVIDNAACDENMHEANILRLNSDKARNMLNVKPVLSIREAVHLTAQWYKEFESTDAYELCIRQIKLALDKN